MRARSTAAFAQAVALGLLAAGTAAAEPTTPTRTAAEWYAMGGWIMHLLLGCSVFVLAVSLERIWALRPAAIGAVQERVRATAAALGGAAPELRLEESDRVCAFESAVMRQNLNLLSAIASLATMLGLLGTVLGMVEAFDRIAVAGTGDARIVADGIFRALVTTAAGLSVAVVATAVHAVLRRRVERAELAMAELFQTELDEGADANAADELGVVATSPS